RWFNRDKLKWYEGRYGPEWLHHMRTMIDALAEGHTLEAYRNHRKTPSFSYGDIRWCLRSRQSISSEVRGVTMKPLALAMGRSHHARGCGIFFCRRPGAHRAYHRRYSQRLQSRAQDRWGTGYKVRSQDHAF